MTFKKLTYSGTECKSYVYFAFESDYFDTNTITSSLNIEPTSVRNKKEPVPKTTSWKYNIDAGNNINLKSHLEKLIDIFEPYTDKINILKAELKLKTIIQFVIHIDINPETSTPFFGFNNRTIEFLSKTETEVDFDVYKVDTMGLLDNLK